MSGKEGDCRASWKYEMTKERVVPLHQWIHQEKDRMKILLSLYLSKSRSVYLSHPLFLHLSLYVSLCPGTTAYSPHTRGNRISIHVLPRSLATTANGRMQLACTHSKRPFEYSSANSCIHWYLKCSGSARALNSRYIWLNLKKKGTKSDIGDKDQDSPFCPTTSNPKWQTQIGVFASLVLWENESTHIVYLVCDLLIKTYNVLKVCHCQSPPDHPLHINIH